MDEEIKFFVEELKKANKAIIVEGKKDKAALKSKGVKNIYVLDKPLFAVVEEVAENNKEVVILTDLDKKGRQLYSFLSSGLQRHGVQVDNFFREFLLRKTKIRQIEGL